MSMEINRVKFFLHRADIEYMKKLALIIMMSGIVSVAVSGEEYTIQTISAKKVSSITPVFEKKVDESTLPSSKKKEGNCNIVTVGNYKNAQEAHHDLEKAKIIAKDAFVRPVVRSTPKVCIVSVHHKEGKTVVKHAKTVTKHPKSVVKTTKNSPHQTEVVTKNGNKGDVQHVAETAEGVSPAHEEVAVSTVSEHKGVSLSDNEHSITAQAHPVAATGTVSDTPCKTQPCTKTPALTYVYDRNLLRKSDISDAIEFYKNSPYHSFRPMALGR